MDWVPPSHIHMDGNNWLGIHIDGKGNRFVVEVWWNKRASSWMTALDCVRITVSYVAKLPELPK